jgi:hypothetical protein
MSKRKPWLEQWEPAHTGPWRSGDVGTKGTRGVIGATSRMRAIYPSDAVEDTGWAAADLIAAAPALVRALLIVEFCGGRADGYGGAAPMCPECWHDPGAHQAGCAIDATLSAAGLPDQASRDAARAEIAGRK